MQVVPFYLPQFHSIPENDAFWGKGFTEWTNVKKAKALFKGHHQPKVPGSDLGYYQLPDPATMHKQEQIAEQYGIYGFAYWHYWFGNGKTVLEQPLHHKLSDPGLRLRFCMAWANESWTGKWHGLGDEILVEQLYPGADDFRAHFDYLLPFFKDKRYMRFEDQPIFMVNKPFDMPEEELFVQTFREEASKNGFKGIFLIESRWQNDFRPDLYDGAIHIGQFADLDRNKNIIRRGMEKVWPDLKFRDSYTNFSEIQIQRALADHEFPVVFPNWDNTPRMGKEGLVLQNPDPKRFEVFLNRQYQKLTDRKSSWAEQFVFVKSWNEWAEGNYLEPDSEYGYAYLEKINDLMLNLAMDFLT